MILNYLDFDFSEDAQGHGSFDAMASATPAQRPALEAEVLRVLDWAHRDFGGTRGPLDEGADWDYDLQGAQEVATHLDVSYNPQSQRLQLQPAATGAPRLTLSLAISGTAAFCAAFRDAFGLAVD